MKVIVKNLISLTLGESLSKLVGLCTTVYLARTLAPSVYGHIGFALSCVSYFALLIYFGLDTVGLRETSRNILQIRKLFNNILSIRILLTGMAVFCISVFLLVARFETVRLVTLCIFTGMLLSNTFAVQWIFNGLDRMKPIAFTQVISSASTLLCVLLFVKSPDDIYIAAVIMVFSALLQCFLLYLMYIKIGTSFHFEFDKAYWRYLFKEAYPLFVSSVAIAVYYNMDIVLLGFLRSSQEVGEYTAAYKIHASIILPASLILNAMSPKLSRAFGDKLQQNRVSGQYARMMFIVGMPVSAFVFFYSDPMIRIIFGLSYANAGFALSMLALNAAFVFINMAYGNPLPIWYEQKKYMWCITAGGIGNVILNLLFIPPYGYNGASIATLLSEVIVFVGLISIFYRMQRVSHLRNLIPMILISYGIGYLFHLYLTVNVLNIPVVFICYLCVVVLAVFVFRIVRPGEVKLLLE